MITNHPIYTSVTGTHALLSDGPVTIFPSDQHANSPNGTNNLIGFIEALKQLNCLIRKTFLRLLNLNPKEGVVRRHRLSRSRMLRYASTVFVEEIDVQVNGKKTGRRLLNKHNHF